MRIQAFATSARLNFAIMETVILHSCCAPCSAAVLEWMLAHDIRPIVFYFNPNIFPQAEYEKRKAELTVHCQRLGVEVVDGDWDHWRPSKGWKMSRNAADAVRFVSPFDCVRLQNLLTTAALPALPPLWPLAAGRILTKSMPQGKKRLNIMLMSNIGTKTGEKTACKIGAMPF